MSLPEIKKGRPNFSAFNYRNRRDFIQAKSKRQQFEEVVYVHGMLLILNGIPSEDALRIVKEIKNSETTEDQREFIRETCQKARGIFSQEEKKALSNLALATRDILNSEQTPVGPCLARLEAIGRSILASFPEEKALKLVEFSRNLINQEKPLTSFDSS